jgi:hypothetical protein
MARNTQIYCSLLSFLCTNVDVTKHAMGVMDNISFNLPSSLHIFFVLLEVGQGGRNELANKILVVNLRLLLI